MNYLKSKTTIEQNTENADCKSEGWQKKNLSQRFPVLSLVGIIFCFVLFPAGIINLSLNHLFKTREANSRAEIENSIDLALKTIDRYNDNEYFAHYLLLKINQTVLSSPEPQKTFLKLKNLLQKKFPDAFTFIYWNENGEQIKELSDDASLSYIIKKTYLFLKKVSDFLGNWDETHEQASLANLTDIDKEAKMLRNFLGKLLVIYQLRFPWFSGQLGKPLQTAPPGPRSRIWYRINKKFGMLCFINNQFILSKAGAEFGINRVKKEFPHFRVHLSEYPASEIFFPPADSENIPKLIQALSRFESMSPNGFEEFTDILIGCRQIGQSQRAVCYCSKDLLFSPDRERFRHFGQAARVCLPLLFVLAVWLKTRKSNFTSIRIKLIAVFLYAGGIPLLIMGSIGLEFLEQKQQQMVYEGQTRGLNVLYNVDRNFKTFLENLSQRLSGISSRYNRKFALQILRPEVLTSLRNDMLAASRAESIQLFNESGRNLVKDSPKTIFSDYTLASQIAMEILRSVAPPGSQAAESLLLTENFSINALAKRQEITFMSLGYHELYFFFALLGEPRNYRSLAMLQLFWRKEILQKNFFTEFHAENLYHKLAEGVQVVAYYPSEDLVTSDEFDRESLKAFGQYAFFSQIARKSSLLLKNGNYTAVAMRGLNLDKMCLIYLLPMAGIARQITFMQRQMIGLAIIFLVLSFMMFRFLASQFLDPIGEIRGAIESMDRRDFSYRLTIGSSKEFKELAQTFNATLETLKDLETARIVQENLLPPGDFELGSLQLVAFSQPFSRIGGDYFDYFAIGSGNLGIFIGDVSGHGISAALVMAMAKATMIHGKNNFSNNENLVNALDQTISLNRKTGTKEYMTGLFLTFDCETGDGQLINRGHCMPILISRDGNSLEHIKSSGQPLGYGAPGIKQTVDLHLNPGEFLCLYTDGMAEAQNERGEILGYEGLKKMLQVCWNAQIEVYLQALLQSHKKWTRKQDDDQTVILVKRKR